MINTLRVIRLFRLAVIINRLQRSRDAAAMRRKRAMYRRMGAPVEKVLQFLTNLRARTNKQRDQYNIDWMMEVIASDELYSVAEFDEETLATMQGGSAGSADMSRFLGAETGLARKPGDEEEGGVDDGKKGQGEKSFVRGRKTSFSGASGADAEGGSGLVLAQVDSWAGAAIATSGLNRKLQKLLNMETAWSFDIFEYDKACDALEAPGTGKAATLLCYYLLEQHGVLDALKLERSKILAWLTCVEEDYNRANPYHNALHAADVCANVDYFIRQPNLNKLLSPLDILAALISAIIHDMGHPGVNNTFLEATKHELAIIYNDVSVLENHHVAAAFKLLKRPELDWTKEMALDDYKDLRETVVQVYAHVYTHPNASLLACLLLIKLPLHTLLSLTDGAGHRHARPL